jgi:hypothetical protein
MGVSGGRFALILTSDVERRPVVAGLQEATEEDGDVCDFAGAEKGRVLV